MSVMVTTRINRLADDADEDTVNLPGGTLCSARKGKLMRLPVAPTAPEQRILAVEFRSPDGRSWEAIGGGDTVAAAILYARESCPDDATWDAVGWNELYGD
jgi:hypothetical protein